MRKIAGAERLTTHPQEAKAAYVNGKNVTPVQAETAWKYDRVLFNPANAYAIVGLQKVNDFRGDGVPRVRRLEATGTRRLQENDYGQSVSGGNVDTLGSRDFRIGAPPPAVNAYARGATNALRDFLAESKAAQPRSVQTMKLGMWIAIGIGIGTAVGVAFEQTAMGVALGAAFGVALGSGLGGKRQK